MTSNKSALHRHLRKNSQPSPTSPAFPRRMHGAKYSDPFSPIEAPSATTNSLDSPTLDVHVPSASFDFLGENAATSDSRSKSSIRSQTGENVARRPQMLAGVGRPHTSDVINTHTHFPAGENVYQEPQYSQGLPTPSPRYLAAGRSSSEFSPRYAEGQSPRGFNVSPQFNSRGFGDDGRLPAQKKSRLNLLNPMSLLARRRTSQNQGEATDLTINTLHVPAMPENFNPSIRGTITHDFSAPRSRRTPSHGDAAHMENFRHDFGPQSASMASDVCSPVPNLQPPHSGNTPSHSPMFKEHFQDDRKALRPDQTAYLHHAVSQTSGHANDYEQSMPAFAKKLPSHVPEQQTKTSATQNPRDRPLPDTPISPPPPPPPPKHTPPLPLPAERPPSSPREQRTPTPPLNIPAPSHLPKHMTSTSSRFSFQLGGQASSAQERLLEEKHKQFQDTKRVSSLSHQYGGDDDDYDDYGFDADAGLEEDVPEFGMEDYPEDEFGGLPFDRSKIENSTSVQRSIPPTQWKPREDDGFEEEEEHEAVFDRSKIEIPTSTQNQSLQEFHFTPDSLTFSPSSSNNVSQPTPRDEGGMVIGVADPEQVATTISQDQRSSTDDDQIASTADFLGGLGISTRSSDQTIASLEPKKLSVTFDDADLYFDDGEFADHSANQNESDRFDEDMLDDEMAIRDIPAENLRRYESAKYKAGTEGKVGLVDGENVVLPAAHRISAWEESARLRGSSVSGAALTEGNLAAYHSLLVNAANEAAANGKFNRVSFSQDSEDESQPGVISDESRFSNNIGGSGIAYDDGFPFDDDEMDDEMMIAAANAEALENDDDGFYGQEFGFYARARNKEESDMVNGGFFAPRGSNGVKRSHSGRANFQEPSLTPITERSEWSTRNSVASLQIPGGLPQSAASLPSPGIAQLLERDSPVHDEDMTLSALMKLRRGAFGGSSTSINSIGPNPSITSPLAQYHPHPFSPQESFHNRMSSSIHSIPASSGIPESEEEDDYLNVDENTLTQNTPMKKTVEPRTSSEYQPMSPMLGLASGGSKRSNHSRTSSGAESVSYSREADGRWVLERRRTGEDGSSEIDREYLAGARI